LQTTASSSTCKQSCDDGYTTDGNIEHFFKKDKPTEIDATKTYYRCVDCDLPCETCWGQGKYENTLKAYDYGKKGDKERCRTCSATFNFLVKSEEKCFVTCSAGYFEKKVGLYPDYGECGVCKKPCSTCRKCKTGKKGDENCLKRKDKQDPSSFFCLSCDQ